MKGSLRLRLALALVVGFLGLMYMLPSIPAVGESPIGKVLPSNKINLGLDLKGGIHLTLGVDVKKALENSLAQMGRDIRSVARDKDIVVLKPETQGGEMLSFTLLKAEQRPALEELITSSFGNFEIDSVTPAGDGKLDYVLKLSKESRTALAAMTVDQAVKTIRNRIDQFGVAEPDIRKQQGNRIQVQLPGLSDPERAIDIIGKTAHLEFKLVDDDADAAKAKQGILPPGDELAYMQAGNQNGAILETPIVLKKDAVLTGEYVADARTNFDQYNQPYVTLIFTSRGAQLFERLTTENVKKRMAIVLDGKVYSAPVIQEPIAGGRASITGRFSVEESRDLAIVLRAGSLPAPISVLEQRTVGPSLGQESIDKGVTAAIIGLAAVLGFMAIYYGFAGVVANLALVMNIVLIMAGLAVFGATLTMPGIAGIILTIGMAVDANVIIFERVREELRRGLTVRAAIGEGFSRASMTIFDANLTTVIAAAILYEFGTGPIRGFAVTLILGILSSMFTAIFVSRVIFDLYTSRRTEVAKLSI